MLKNRHFSKGVNPWFWSKNGNFSNFYFLGNTGQENVFYDIHERKNAFLGCKNKKLKKVVFVPKMAIFSIFFLANIGQENAFYNILEQKKKRLSNL